MFISETIIKNGFFYKPEKPSEAYPGRLKITDGGHIELELTTENAAFTSMDEMHIGRLLGSVEGGYVTLENCAYKTMSLAFGGGTSTSLITSSVCFDGVGIIGDELFQKMRFCLDGLSEWWGKSAFEIRIAKEWKDSSIHLNISEELVCLLPDGTLMKLSMEMQLPGVPKFPKTELFQRAYIEIQPTEHQSLEFYISLSHKITRFFSFLLGVPAAIHSLQIKLEIEDERSNKWMDLYFQSLNNSLKSKKAISARDMLLPYAKIAKDFERLLSSWLIQYENLMPALHHYYSIQDERNFYADTKFLALAQALEAFHRRTTDMYNWPKPVFQKKLNAIVEAAPIEDREWVRQRLCFANEITLADRLRDLLTPFKNIFGEEEGIVLIIKNTKDTRNYHAHYDEKGFKKALRGAPLVALTMRLRVLFALCLVKHLGMSVTDAEDLTSGDCLRRFLESAKYIERSI